jgi:hypothetical protein
MGIRTTTELEAQAAFLSAAAMAETALREGADQYRPFAGPNAPALKQVWQSLHAEAAASHLWSEESLNVDNDCIDKVLPGVQHTFSRFVADRRGQQLMASFNGGGMEGRQHQARLRSCASRAASAWIEALPTSAALRLTDLEFASSMRHRLGLSHMPANAPGVQCFCGRHMGQGNTDHAMTCKSLSGAMTLRHDNLKHIWRRIANRAGVATSAEPVLRPLRGVQAAAIANRPESRGDILLVLPDGLTVADVSVVHPAAPTYVAAAAQTDGSAAAARDQLKRARYQSDDPAAYAFQPLSVETYGRMGKPAMQMLNTLASAAVNAGVQLKGDFVTNALRELSVGLCRGNSVLYRRSLYVLARASGIAFRAGMDVPSADVP